MVETAMRILDATQECDKIAPSLPMNLVEINGTALVLPSARLKLAGQPTLCCGSS
jgi:hypothetical protein